MPAAKRAERPRSGSPVRKSSDAHAGDTSPTGGSGSTGVPSASPKRNGSPSSPSRGATEKRSRSRSRSRAATRDKHKHTRRIAKSANPAVKFVHRRTSHEVWRCKKGKRSEIKPSEWDKFGYFKNDEVISRPITYDSQTVPIPRVKRENITPEWFLENVAKKNQPVIVENACSHWPAMHRWSIDALEERFRHIAFKVAKDDKGKKLRMKFKYYADYIRRQQDDSPLYLFETSMDESGYIRQLTNDFEIPDIFPHDWFSLMNADSRPPYRWFCIGPKRSGTTVHIDPLGTSAWNAVTHGVKRWILFEPQEKKRIVTGKDHRRSGEDDEAIMYFDFILPRLKKAHPELKSYEGLQNPGDVIFVPGDWWHGVLNLEDSIAVTQNYAGPDNFDLVWKKTRKEREKVAYLWLRNMKRYASELHKRAVELNKEDGFRMRHERAPGEQLSNCSSSSSSSSSDSSSDEAEDIDPEGLHDVLRKDLPVGAQAFKLQGDSPPALASTVVVRDRTNSTPQGLRR